MATILVIEDNQQNCYLTTFLLEKQGHTVLQAQAAWKESQWLKCCIPISYCSTFSCLTSRDMQWLRACDVHLLSTTLRSLPSLHMPWSVTGSAR